jgi:hypothetical protein
MNLGSSALRLTTYWLHPDAAFPDIEKGASSVKELPLTH